MTCEVIQAEGIAERYARGSLTAEERTAFEEHYAICTDCFERLRSLEASLGSGTRTGARGKKRRKRHRPRKYGWIFGLAAVLAAAAGLAVVLNQYRLPSPAPETAAAPSAPVPEAPASPSRNPAPDPAVVASLAVVEAPVYVESKRHADNAAYKAFQAAMESYDLKDYPKAGTALRAAAQLDATSPAPLFYLAICELLLHQTDAAMDDLYAVIALDDTAFREDAHFFLAKALLAQQNLPEAREELFRTIRMAGGRLMDARHVLDQLDLQTPRK